MKSASLRACCPSLKVGLAVSASRPGCDFSTQSEVINRTAVDGATRPTYLGNTPVRRRIPIADIPIVAADVRTCCPSLKVGLAVSASRPGCDFSTQSEVINRTAVDGATRPTYL